MSTTVVVQQPTGVQDNRLMVTDILGHRQWSTGLFDCFSDIKMCLLGLCCTPCVLCHVASRTGECCCMPHCILGGSVILRSRIRTIGGIQGSACNDCIVLSHCGPCAVCQMERELDNMGVP
ncbi:cornifelin homolog A-like [Saccostrea cucullata]|uniref:cornifelin homolog A-like n=1 Tax=Saccostrea cuccullata TaxID=36930 RepID=UPI002ED4F2F0